MDPGPLGKLGVIGAANCRLLEPCTAEMEEEFAPVECRWGDKSSEYMSKAGVLGNLAQLGLLAVVFLGHGTGWYVKYAR